VQSHCRLDFDARQGQVVAGWVGFPTGSAEPAEPAEIPQVLQSHAGRSFKRPKGVIMFGLFGPIGLPEMLIILAIVVLIFGANRLPELGKGIGAGIKNFKGAMKDNDQK
jgi:sec-independent protein translocase protein TatA